MLPKAQATGVMRQSGLWRSYVRRYFFNFFSKPRPLAEGVVVAVAPTKSGATLTLWDTNKNRLWRPLASPTNSLSWTMDEFKVGETLQIFPGFVEKPFNMTLPHRNDDIYGTMKKDEVRLHENVVLLWFLMLYLS